MPARGVGGDVVVAAAEVLHESVTGGEDPRGAVALQSAHRAEPGFQPPVICLDRVVRILLNGVQRGGDQLGEHPRVDGCAVGRDLNWDRAGAQRASGGLLTMGGGRGMPWVKRECPGVCDDATCAVSCGAGPAGGVCGPV